MSESGEARPWTELRERKPRKATRAPVPRREGKPHHWRNMILSWVAVVVVVGAATYAVNAWVNRSLVVVPSTLGGMPQTTDPWVQSLTTDVRGQQHAEPGSPSSQYTVTGYGTETDYAVSIVVPAGHAFADSDIDQMPDYRTDLSFDAPEVLDGARCVTGTDSGGDTTVWCMRTDDTTSVMTLAGPQASAGRTAAMTGEAFDAQH